LTFQLDDHTHNGASSVMTTSDYIDFSLATVSVPFMMLFLGGRKIEVAVFPSAGMQQGLSWPVR